MANVPQAIGDCSIKEQKGSPKFSYRNNLRSCVRRWRGLSMDLLTWAEGINAGMTFSDIPGIYAVEAAELTPTGGINGMGELVITLTDWAYQTLTNPIVEIVWTDLSKDVITNPLYQLGGAQVLTSDDLAAIQIWKNESDWTAKRAFTYHVPPGASNATTALSAHAAFLAAKLLIGEETFNTSYPVVTTTEYFVARPLVLPGWLRENPPPGFDAPAGYEYMRGCASRTFDRRFWVLRRRWIGAESWDHDHYLAA